MVWIYFDRELTKICWWIGSRGMRKRGKSKKIQILWPEMMKLWFSSTEMGRTRICGCKFLTPI